jgi:thiamine pyrophosphokinase
VSSQSRLQSYGLRIDIERRVVKFKHDGRVFLNKSFNLQNKISAYPSNPQNLWSNLINKMSSHHIIRDAQEPALIIANGEACSFELMGELLEWSPLVIVLDSAINRVLELGIKVDVLLGDFDRDFDAEKIRQEQYPIEIVHTPDQNKTDLEKAFDYLIEKGFPAVNVVWATGRRADHTITNLTSVVKYREQLKIVILDDYSKVFLLPRSYEKWYTAGTSISLIPLGQVDGITTNNLKYSLDNESLMLGYRSGSSNEALADGLVSITHTSGDLLLMECWD